jgi:cathepsin L
MKFSLAIAALVAASASAKAPKHHELTSDYSFKQYVQDFSKSYSAAEYRTREAIFEENKADIIAHNEANLHSFKKGINDFTDMRHDEGHFGYSKGAHDAWNGVRTLTADELPFEVEPADALPASIDWREKGVVTAVKDQGGCGSCWAFAAAATLESHIAIETGTLFNLSPQEFVSCMPNPNKCGGNGGCEGATVDMAFDWMIGKGGIVQEYQMGYTSYYGENGNCTIADDMKNDPSHLGSSTNSMLHDGPDPAGVKGAVANIEGYARLETNDYLTLLNAVAKTGPVAVSVAASPWKAYESGVFEGDFTSESLDVNHAVTLVGYGTDEETGKDYWLIRNSWKPTWAEDGYIRLRRVDPATLEDPDSICGMDVTPQHGTACEGETEAVKVCGYSAIHFDNVIATGGHLVQ